MFKRIVLGLTFVTALGVTSLATPDTAEARWGRYRRPAVSFYYGPPRYSYYRPYRSYYRSYYRPRYYDPYSYGYRPYGYRPYGYRSYYYDRPGISVSFGF